MTNDIVLGPLLAEGKTKCVHGVARNPNEVDIKSKGDITAGDGAKRDIIEGKGVFSTTTTANCMELIGRKGFVSTHYIERVAPDVFRALKLEMIPIEVVIRRIAYGSYLKRRPDVQEGTYFESLVVEFFFKDDARHDPLMIVDPVGDRVLYYDPRQPLTTGFMVEGPIPIIARYKLRLMDQIPHMVRIAKETFCVLEEAWAAQNVTLVDLKIEFGVDSQNQLRVGDVVDNDSWRIWQDGDPNKMLDKQVYRNLDRASLEQLGVIKNNYAWVAEATNKFLQTLT